MKVILAEKPSVAGDIAKVLGATSRKDGYFEGAGWRVTYAYGHLIELAAPAEYGFDKWDAASLPIMPEEFIYKPKDERRKQLSVIGQLFKDADEIICATDAGREGEAIFRYIYNHLRIRKPVRRLWISSLTEEAIKEGFANLKPGSDYDNLYLSAKARNEADWLVGMNASRALTIANSSGTLSVGRVQTPTLSLVCSRYLEHTAFTPKPYYVIYADLSFGGRRFRAKSAEDYEDREFAKRLAGELPAKIVLADKTDKEVTEKAPLPFDITSLQAEANTKFKLNAQRTLDIVQDLYEKHKMLTYPRTGSRYLGDDMKPHIEKNIVLLKELRFDNYFLDCLKYIEDSGIMPAPFDSSKLTDHHAIIPTFQNLDKFSSLGEDEQKIYELVCRQLVKSLLPACRKNVLTYDFIANGKTYRARGTKILFAGWRLMNEQDTAADGEAAGDEDDKQQLPAMNPGDEAAVENVECAEKFTKKPPLLSEATLLKAMETAGKLIKDEDLSLAIKDCGLGTPATRAATIEILKHRKYIKTEKNKLLPTELGLQVYELLKEQPIASPEMTGLWEKKLNEIASGKFAASDFYKEIREYVAGQVAALLSSGNKIRAAASAVTGLTCPLCGKPLQEGKISWHCSGYKDGCAFNVWKETNGAVLDADDLKAIAAGGTSKTRDFKKQDGTKFRASLFFSKEKGRVAFKYETKEPLGKCPLCGKDVMEGGKSYYCTGYKDGCQYSFWSEINSKKITPSLAREIIAKGRTGKVSGFKGKSGKTFGAALYYDKGENKLKFDFGQK